MLATKTPVPQENKEGVKTKGQDDNIPRIARLVGTHISLFPPRSHSQAAEGPTTLGSGVPEIHAQIHRVHSLRQQRQNFAARAHISCQHNQVACKERSKHEARMRLISVTRNPTAPMVSRVKMA